MKQRPRRVDADRANVVKESDDEKLRIVGRILCLFIRLRPAGCTNAGHTSLDRFSESLCDGTTVIELRFPAGHPELDRGLRRDPALPLDPFRAELELVKCFSSELGNADDHAVRGAKPQIRARDGFHGARPGDASFGNTSADAKLGHLSRANGLQTGRSDCERWKVVLSFDGLHAYNYTVLL